MPLLNDDALIWRHNTQIRNPIRKNNFGMPTLCDKDHGASL
jgi:hypothetical protein